MTTDQDEPITLSTERPTLINLWSSTCASCLVELSEWATHKDELQAAGVEAITFGTDHLAEDSNPAAALATLAKTRSTFKNYRISEEGLQSLDELQRAVLDRWIPMPVPASFLIHSSGELIAIYKGPVSTAQLLHDIPLASADPTTRRDAALPFPGQWVGPPTPADPKRVASLMLDHNRLDAAIGYLASAGEFLEVRASDENHKRALGDLYFMAGTLTGLEPESQKQATDLLVRARDLIPGDLRIRTELGRRYLAGGNLQACKRVRRGIRDRPIGYWTPPRHRPAAFPPRQLPAGERIPQPDCRCLPRQWICHTTSPTLRSISATSPLRSPDTATHSDPPQNYSMPPTISPRSSPATLTRNCDPPRNSRPRPADLPIERGEKPTIPRHPRSRAGKRGNFRDVIASAKKAIALHPPENQQAVAAIANRVKLYESSTPYREAAWQ